MDTSVNKTTDWAQIVLGEETMSELLTAEQMVDVLYGVMKEMKPTLRALHFTRGGDDFPLGPTISAPGLRVVLPDELRRMRILVIGVKWGSAQDGTNTLYCITPAAKWLQIIVKRSSNRYVSHEWLDREALVKILQNDPSLLWRFLQGLQNHIERAVSYLRYKSDDLKHRGDRIRQIKDRMYTLGTHESAYAWS